MPGHEVDDYLGIHGGLEDGPFLFQAVTEFLGVDQVAVMTDGQSLTAVMHHKGLGIAQQG